MFLDISLMVFFEFLTFQRVVGFNLRWPNSVLMERRNWWRVCWGLGRIRRNSEFSMSSINISRISRKLSPQKPLFLLLLMAHSQISQNKTRWWMRWGWERWKTISLWHDYNSLYGDEKTEKKRLTFRWCPGKGKDTQVAEFEELCKWDRWFFKQWALCWLIMSHYNGDIWEKERYDETSRGVSVFLWWHKLQNWIRA